MAGRGRPPKPKEQRTDGYFYTDEETAVVKYIQTNSAKEKNDLYESTLKPAFTRMIESIIRKYFREDIALDDFQMYFNDTMYHVIEMMPKFKPERGKKAYSYIGTIARHYVLGRLIDKRKVTLRDVCYDDMSEEINDCEKYSYSINNQYNSDMSEIIVETTFKINNLISEEYNQKLSHNELLVGNALVELMTNWDESFADMGSNKFNKSTILLYLKETTNLSTNDVRKSMRKFKNIYLKTKENILQ